MLRFEIINELIRKHGYQSYLEIGVYDCHECFDRVQVERKVAVDPKAKNISPGTLMFHGTSDAFFQAAFGLRFDVIFIDGLHQDLQVRRDLHNSLQCLNSNGTIVMHDCLPSEEAAAGEQPDFAKSPAWFGTCWKAFAHYRMTRPDLFMFTLNTDCGCGIVRRGRQALVPQTADLTWDYYVKNRDQVMNVKSVEEARPLL